MTQVASSSTRQCSRSSTSTFVAGLCHVQVQLEMQSSSGQLATASNYHSQQLTVSLISPCCRTFRDDDYEIHSSSTERHDKNMATPIEYHAAIAVIYQAINITGFDLFWTCRCSCRFGCSSN